ncbi:MAG: peptidyl-prolyl cis-trans isomerase SurA, partial [Bacteroidota bacterium]|nr:peptidyl-prolyl cis-trans isomerase SurA [Bacteroidota bacterium]
MKISLYLLAAVMFLFTVSDAAAQLKNGESIAKIVAVVGDEAILDSDINGQIMMLAQQNRNIIPNDPQLRRQVLDAMINEKLLVTKAIEDSIEASDDEVNQRWNYLLQMYIQKFGSEKRIESIFGMSIARLKYEYTDEIRKQILSEKIRQQKFGMVSVTPHEVEEYYNSQKDSIPELPDRIELYHIVKYVVSNVKLKEEILEHVKKIRDSLINGGNFADFAK